MIHSLSSEEGIVRGEDTIHLHISNRFKGLFRISSARAWDHGVDLREIKVELLEDEIEKAIWKLDPDRNPGPDS